MKPLYKLVIVIVAVAVICLALDLAITMLLNASESNTLFGASNAEAAPPSPPSDGLFNNGASSGSGEVPPVPQ